MNVEIKNSSYKPKAIKPLYDYFQSLGDLPIWEYQGLLIELDPTFDFKGDDVLVRWTDIKEGYNDKFIVNSIYEFNTHFKLIHA